MELIFSGKLVGENPEYAVFESSVGRIFKLKGVARTVCETALHQDKCLDEILQTLNLAQEACDAIRKHLVDLKLFCEEAEKKSWKRFIRFRLDLPLIPQSVVNQMCVQIDRHYQAIQWVTFVLLCGGVFVLLSEGMPLTFGGENIAARTATAFVFLNVFLHEVGHAFALYRYGQKPGVIGLRIIGPFMAAYTDVNAAWVLPPYQRAMISAAGLSVQMVTTVILTATLVHLTNPATARIFLTVTLITVIYMALPMRENDGDWFLKDLTQHYPSKSVKTALTVARKLFAILGLTLFAWLLSKGWYYLLFKLDYSTIKLEWSSWTYALKGAFLSLGTYSFVKMVLKEVREIAELLASLKPAPKPTDSKPSRSTS